MHVKYQELVELHNMTVFTIDDAAIFVGAVSYVESARFHVVPDHLLVHSDLVRLSEGTVLPTLIHGRRLVVTTSGAGISRLRINFVPIKAADVMYNEKIAVHGIYMPFPVPGGSSGGASARRGRALRRQGRLWRLQWLCWDAKREPCSFGVSESDGQRRPVIRCERLIDPLLSSSA